MKVTKSTIHKLEIERPCGCKIAGDYEDAAYKKARGASNFAACEAHKDAAPLVEDLLREVLDKEALEAKAPEAPAPVSTIHPRTAALQAPPNSAAASASASPPDGPPARTLRTVGTNGTAGREQNRSGYGVPKITPSRIRRVDANAGLSPQAAAKVARVAPVSASTAIDIDIGGGAKEDPRLTNVLNEMDLFRDDGGGDEDL